jgi:glycerol-3-phosphate acyltransferase PlsY
MGLAAAGGGLLAVSWLAFVVGIGLLVALTLTIKHGARASVITGILLAPIFFLVGLRGPVIWIGAFAGLVFAARFAVDWQRHYKELWLDREQKAG